jgi:type II secretory pathway component GspD/PulD (secretin)
LWTVAVLASACWSVPAVGAEAEFVGVLALTIEEAVAEELELTEDQKAKLLKLIDSREGSQELNDLVLPPEDQDPADREQRLARFRSESEAMGLLLLSPQQRAQLQRIRFRESGLAALAEPKVAEDLVLSDEQQSRVAEILAERNERLRGAAQDRIHVIRAETERKLGEVLTRQQRAAWHVLTAAAEGQPPAVRPAESGVAAPRDPADVFGRKPPEAADQPAQGPPDEPVGDEMPFEFDEGLAPEETTPPGMLRFNFRAHPWAEVLEWFADQANLSYVADFAPQGTFNYIDDKEYTPAEAIDLLNRVLLTKGYTLVIRERMLFLLNVDEDGEIPDILVPKVPLEQLDKKGESELVSVLFPLEEITPDQARQEIEGLLGPQGKIVILPLSRQIQVTETGGRLRAIRSVIERIEGGDGLSDEQLQTFTLKFATPEEALTVMRQMFGIDGEEFATEDDSIRLALDPVGNRLLATAKPDMLARVKEILDAIDVIEPIESGVGIVDEELMLVVYAITVADPESVLAVLQTLLAGEPDVRLAIDPKTSSLVALARPSQHATFIRPTLDQYEGSARVVEVIHLRVVDPAVAVIGINKLFGAGGDEPNPNAPQVDADPISRQLLVRGTASQIEQIRTLLEKMGETDTTQPAVAASGGNVRILSLNSRAARTALEQLQEFWPALRGNRIRVVTPSALIPRMRSSGPAGPPEPEQPDPDAPSPLPAEPAREPAGAQNPPEPNKAAVLPGGARVFFAAQTNETQPPDETEPQPPAEPDPIVVTFTPGGVMLASQDTQALDEFEEWLTMLAGGAMAEVSYPTIFYLKNAKAALVAETLDQIFGGGTLAESSGGSLVGDLAGAALGGTAGGIIGAMLGRDGGTIAPSGLVRITPEPRLNALIVQAGPADTELIEEILKILDQKESPEEVLVIPKSKIIPVFNTQAARIAEIIKEVFRTNLMTSGGTSGGSSRPSPEQLIQMLRGSSRGGSGRGGSRRPEEEVQKMSIGVDVTTNSLVVAAPEPLLTQVEQLVMQLDQLTLESNNQVIVTRRLHNISPNVVRNAVSALMGESVQIGGSTRSSSRSQTSSSRPSPSTSSQSSDDARRAFFLDMMRRRMESGGSSFGRSSGGGPPGRGGSFGSRPSGSGGPPSGRGPSSGGGRPGGGGPPGGSR